MTKLFNGHTWIRSRTRSRQRKTSALFCIKAFLICVAAVLLTANFALAQDRPANDQFARRETLTGDFAQVLADNTLATSQPGEPAHGDGLGTGRTLWWTWTAPTNGWATIDTSQSPFTPSFAVYRGEALASFQVVSFNSRKCIRHYYEPLTLTTSEIFPVLAGETLQIAFDSPRPDFGDPANAPYGNFKFALIFSRLEITYPSQDAVFPIGSNIPIEVALKTPPGNVTGISLELDGVILSQTPVYPGDESIFLALADIPPGLHTVRALTFDPSGPSRSSPPISFSVRPINDNFAHAIQLRSARKITVEGTTEYATYEPGEPSHPAGHDGLTIWYQWLATQDGILRIEIPGNYAITVFTGANVNSLSLVAANPEVDNSYWYKPLYPIVHFSVRQGTVYNIQLSHKFFGPHPVGWFGPCDPPQRGYPLSFQLEFVPNSVGRLDFQLTPAFPPFSPENVLFSFAAKKNERYVLEMSDDLGTWSEAASGLANGATELLRVPSNLLQPAKYFRVRLL